MRLLLRLEIEIGHVENADAARSPLTIHLLCDGAEYVLTVAMVAHDEDVLESGVRGAERHISDNSVVGLWCESHRAGKSHVRRFLHRIARDSEWQSGIDQSIAQLDCDRTGEVPRDEVVFPDGHVRAVLLGAADVDDRARLARLDP